MNHRERCVPAEFEYQSAIVIQDPVRNSNSTPEFDFFSLSFHEDLAAIETYFKLDKWRYWSIDKKFVVSTTPFI
jgi:hypothetical protein